MAEDLKNLNELEKHLYGQKKGLPRRRGISLFPKKYGLPSEWSIKVQEEEKKKFKIPASFFKKFFLISLGFFVLTAVVSLVIFFSGRNVVSQGNIEINVSGASFAVGGEKLPLLIEIKNKNRVDLELADLVVEYEKGGLEGEITRLRQPLGDIPAGGVVNKLVEPVLLGEEGSAKELRIALEYRLKNSNAIFVKETKHSVVLSSAPLIITFDGPSSVSPEQDFVFSVKVVSNSRESLSHLNLSLRYPPGFIFGESEPQASFSNNFFDLGDLPTGGERTIKIRGKLLGGAGEARTLAMEVGEADAAVAGKLKSVYSTKLQTISLVPPFVEARISVFGEYKDEYAARSQDEIPVTINWSNNLSTQINNLEIRAKISGLFDKKSVKATNGFYDSANDVIIFDKTNNGDFATVPPGSRGTVEFSLSSLPLYSGNILQTDPQIAVEVSVKGLQPALGTIAEISNFERKVIKISSDLQLLAKALHFSGPLTNTGPIPPKADTETTYTIVWTITNTSNNVTKAKVSAILPPYVKFIGQVTPATEPLSFNENSREVVWRPGSVVRGAGFTASSKEVAFKISFRPSQNQVGASPTIIGEANLVGEDVFTKQTLQSRRSGLDIRLADDVGFPAGGGVVVE